MAYQQRCTSSLFSWATITHDHFQKMWATITHIREFLFSENMSYIHSRSLTITHDHMADHHMDNAMHWIFENRIVTHNNNTNVYVSKYLHIIHIFQTYISFFHKNNFGFDFWLAFITKFWGFMWTWYELKMSVNLAKKWAKFTHLRELKLVGKYEPNMSSCSWVNKVFTFIHLSRWYILLLCFFLLLNQYFLKIISYNAFENVAKMLW